MTFVSDATSLILLAKANLLEVFVRRNNVVIPKLVYGEVAKGKDKGREDSILVEKLIAKNQLSVVSANKAIKDKIGRLFNIKGGEQEVIAIASEKKHIVITDDKRCINAAKALDIFFVTSLDVVVALYKNGVISKEKVIHSIDALEEYGWYSKELVKYYKEAIK